MDALNSKFDEFMREYVVDRREARKERQCLRDSFLEFHNEFTKVYKPILDDAVKDQAKWKVFVERQKDWMKENGFRFSLLTILGLAAYGAAGRVVDWIAKAQKLVQ